MSAGNPIEVDPELAALLKQAAESGEPLTVSIDDKSYDIMIHPTANRKKADLWKDYDPEAIRRAVADVAGVFTEEEGEALIKRVRKAHEAGSRPSTRP
ncbi:hypothetical protein BH23CHL2_BH23CHL2_21180 [soil metagenome]